MLNFLAWIAMTAVALALGIATIRAWRIKNAFLKWGGMILSGLLTLVVALVSVVTLIGLIKVYTPRDVPVRDLQVEGTSEQIARGEHIAEAFCTSCHSTTGDLPLTGGVDLGKDFPIPLGSFVSVNLTPAGSLKDWSDGEIFRAIRTGTDKDGHGLFVMSNIRARNLSDEDIEAVIAYLRNQPPAGELTQNPPDQPSLLGIIMFGAGMLPAGQPPFTGEIVAPPKGPTAAYGEYITHYQDCRDCHGEDLSGGQEGQLSPIGPNLAMVKGWTQQEFIDTLRTGVDPSGHELNSGMPWRAIGRLDDEELTALYEYLNTLP